MNTMPHHPYSNRWPSVPAAAAVRAWVAAVAFLAALFAPGACRPAQAGALVVAHELAVELVPSAHVLIGNDRMVIRVDDRWCSRFRSE
jgi:hypothetical protein